ncbi:hypothetical protein [Anthocerotibacter panamensis]|uniref:hypothetical protein n=1 Tax=Anthocerotibacter panamensis TaxID=2857077 RepID=UPI001C406FE5|nr:hypothetical protein [Anthocerotibacter panamensis]
MTNLKKCMAMLVSAGVVLAQPGLAAPAASTAQQMMADLSSRVQDLESHVSRLEDFRRRVYFYGTACDQACIQDYELQRTQIVRTLQEGGTLQDQIKHSGLASKPGTDGTVATLSQRWEELAQRVNILMLGVVNR